LLRSTERSQSREVPRARRLVPRTFQQCLAAALTREAAQLLTCRDHGITMTALAAELGLSVTRVSRVIACVGSDEARPQMR
jgi:putative transposase